MSSASVIRDTVGGVNTAIAAGTKIVAYNEVGTTPTLIGNNGLKVECPESVLTGSIHNNGTTGGVVMGTIEDAWFQGNEAETHCKSSIGAATVTVQLTNQLAKTNHWCIETLKEDKFQVVPHNCTGVGGEFTFVIHAGGMSCGFVRSAAIGGTFTTGDVANAPVTLTMTNNQEFTTEMVPGHSILCPASGKLSEFKFQMYTDTNGTSGSYRPANDLADPVNITEN